MSDCIFCKIRDGAINANIVYQTDNILAFRDVNPQAPIHILIIPKKHIARLTALEESDLPLVGEIHRAAKLIAEKENLSAPGFRLVVNNGVNGGQTVDHLHYHLLGGRVLTWPPG